MSKLCWACTVLFIVLLQNPHPSVVEGQQIYLNNKQLQCYNDLNFTDGYACNGVQRSCEAYLTFRSTPIYNSPADIGLLLGAEPSLIAEANNLSNFDTLSSNTQILIPVNCSCSGAYYQHNATYKLSSDSETYLLVANDTYQGLTTCQAMMAQNPYDSRNLSAGLNLEVPLRCACPTSNQTAAGIKYLVTYLVTWGQDFSSIAKIFGVDMQSILDANELSVNSIIFPFTPLLVPLTSKPSKIQITVSPPPPSSPPPPPSVNPDSGNSNTRWVIVGVTVGAIVLLVLSAFLLWFFRGRQSRKKALEPLPPLSPPEKKLSPSHSEYSWSVSTAEVRYAIESLTLYEFDDLQKATGFFGEANKIKGSVYRGSFKGDTAAVKVMKGDVSSEINLLKRINHSNIIRLSGFCVHEGNTYLVYEYAENGSLTDRLHGNRNPASSPLPWKQRIQVAYDVADALNYLHNYADPPHIHKNLKTSNILLDTHLRGKISNFGLARTLEDQDEGLQLTRHVIGTKGYMAPEYIESGVITSKLDVFAFGVVMLELLSGREATAADGHEGDHEGLLYLSIRQVLEGDNVREKLHDFIDPSLRYEYPLDLAFSMAQLAKSCVAHDLNSRPAMPEVFMTLSKILSSSLDWDPSDERERSRSFGHNHGR